MTDGQDKAAKLVRDKIPQIIRASGATPITRVAEAAEYAQLLRTKLLEEVGEFLESGAVEELADIIEVIRALGEVQGLDGQQLEQLRTAKAAERGGFAGRTVWLGNVASRE